MKNIFVSLLAITSTIIFLDVIDKGGKIPVGTGWTLIFVFIAIICVLKMKKRDKNVYHKYPLTK